MAIINDTVVTIRFFAKGFDPEKTAELLGFTASEATTSTIKRLKSGRVVWSVSLENNEPVPIEEKLESLLSKFTADISAWKTATENIKADVFCGLFLDGWNRGFTLTPKMMKMLADRNLDIGFDVYAPTSSWDEWMDTEKGSGEQ